MMKLFKYLEDRAKKKLKTIILPESYDERVIDAAKFILSKKLAKIIFIDTGKTIPIRNHENLTIIDINFSKQFLHQNFLLLKNLFPDNKREKLQKESLDPLSFACFLLKDNFADGIVVGSTHSTADVLRKGLKIIGLKPDFNSVSSFFLFTFPRNHKFERSILAFADSGVIPHPTSEQLSDIAIQTAENFMHITGIKPKVAFLSFSTKGSAKHPSIQKITDALKMTRKRRPNLICDGELQFDAAFHPKTAERKNPNGSIKGDANIFIFPDLNSGNIAYKIMERVGGAYATGPIVQGLSKPVMDLSRGCETKDIIRMIIIASLF